MKAHRPISANPLLDMEQRSELPALATLLETGFEGWERGNDFVQEMINGEADHNFPGEIGGILGEFVFPGEAGGVLEDNALLGETSEAFQASRRASG